MVLQRVPGVGLSNPPARCGAMLLHAWEPCRRRSTTRHRPWPTCLLARWLRIAAYVLASATVQAAPVEVLTLQRSAEPHAGIAIDYALKVELPEPVVEVLRRGVPLHFQAQVTLLRPRWYWRDERIARAGRTWRLSWQPLTSNWRVGQGGLTQHHATLAEALASMTRATNWLVAEPHRLQADERYLLLFTWRLDASQLPAPMQIEAGGAGWNLRADAEFGVMP
jgi:hypothetical protein